MAELRKIVIIENQFTQFEQIIDHLGPDFLVYPNVEQFKKFLDQIRVILNSRYETARRANAYYRVQEAITNFNPGLLIIDHILVGNHSADNGITLAKRLRRDFKQPILFLSRTPQNHIDVCKFLPGIKPLTYWATKGYSGDELLDADYFKLEVLKKINELFDQAEKETSSLKVKEEILPFLKSLHKTQTEAYGRQPNATKLAPINILEKLIQSLTDNEKPISSELVESFETLKQLTSNDQFGQENWNNESNKMTSLL